jgi:hypothetical protein
MANLSGEMANLSGKAQLASSSIAMSLDDLFNGNQQL